MLLCNLTTEAIAQGRYGSVSGIIVTGDGAPVANAAIEIERTRPNARRFTRRTKSDYNGRFEVAELPSGRYVLKVAHSLLGGDTERIVQIINGRNETAVIEIGKPCARIMDQERARITDSDKAKIVNLALAEALKSLVSSSTKEATIILSAKNIKPEWLTSTQSLKLDVKSENSIQHMADQKGDFMFLSFSEVRVVGSCIAVSVDYSWAVAKSSIVRYVSGSGIAMEFRRERGVWIGNRVSLWVS